MKARGLPDHGSKKEVYDRAVGTQLLKLPLKGHHVVDDGRGINGRVDRSTIPHGETLPERNSLSVG